VRNWDGLDGWSGSRVTFRAIAQPKMAVAKEFPAIFSRPGEAFGGPVLSTVDGRGRFRDAISA